MMSTPHTPIIHLPRTQAQTTLPMRSINHHPIIHHPRTQEQTILRMMATILRAMISRMFQLILRRTTSHPTQLNPSTPLKTTTLQKPHLLHTTTLISSLTQASRTAHYLLSQPINLHSILLVMVVCQLLHHTLLRHQIILHQHSTIRVLMLHTRLPLPLRHQLANTRMTAITSRQSRRLLRLTKQQDLPLVLLRLMTCRLPWST